jgi:aconitase A
MVVCLLFLATMGFFPVDEQSIDYLKLTGRSEKK